MTRAGEVVKRREITSRKNHNNDGEMKYIRLVCDLKSANIYRRKLSVIWKVYIAEGYSLVFYVDVLMRLYILYVLV